MKQGLQYNLYYAQYLFWEVLWQELFEERVIYVLVKGMTREE